VSKPEKGVYIAIPNYRETVTMALAGWLFSLSPPAGESFFLDPIVMQPVDAARNALVSRFLGDSNLEWMFMIDDDIVPWPAILDLRNRGHLIISGLTYITKKGVPIATAITKRYKNQMRIGGIIEGPRPPVEVVGVGTGALMIHRSVLEKIKPPWFRFTYKYDGRRLQGEDLYFSKKARKEGFTLWLDPSFPCGHIHRMDIRQQAQMLGVAIDSSDMEEFADSCGLLDPSKPKPKKKG